MFNPLGTKDGPHSHTVERARITEIHYCDGTGTEILHDNWMTDKGRHRVITKRWTGFTVFQDKQEGRQPPPIQLVKKKDLQIETEVVDLRETLLNNPSLREFAETFMSPSPVRRIGEEESEQVEATEPVNSTEDKQLEQNLTYLTEHEHERIFN